jgi:hypothetical protein
VRTAAAAVPLDNRLVERTAQILSADQIVRANTAWRRARVCLVADGDVAATLLVDHGSVRVGAPGEGGDLPDVVIAGRAQQWQAILGGLHGGLHRAWRYQLLEFGGDPATTFDLWKTIWRLGDALVAAGRERAHAV